MISLYSNKVDIMNCKNYTGIKLKSHNIKVWERMIDMSVRRGISIFEYQFSFMLGNSTIEGIHHIKRLMEWYKVRKKDLHMLFTNLEKAYDSLEGGSL